MRLDYSSDRIEGEGMDLELRLEEGEPQELLSLQEWLVREPELRGTVTVQRGEVRPGTMGALGDALVVAAGSGGALSVLFASLKVWFAQPRRSDVRIELQRADGERIVLDAARVSRPEELVREVLGSDGIE
jgi:Effector Associated Constant Component 1